MSKCICVPPFFEADCKIAGHCLADRKVEHGGDPRVVAFPSDRRALARRRFRHWARDTGVGLLIAVVIFVLFIVMLLVLGVHNNPCEPNQGC